MPGFPARHPAGKCKFAPGEFVRLLAKATCLVNVLGEIMNTKQKNILTAVVLVMVAVIIYVFAVIRAVSQ
jgi:hypothetical protein